MIIRENVEWNNTIKAQKVTPFRYMIVESLDDVIQAVKEAESQGMRIKPVGAGHSPSDIAITDGYLIDTKQLNKFLELDKNQLLPSGEDIHLVNIEAGITVRDLNKELDKKGLALINMGAIDEQTIAGAIATCTHGTGRNHPSLPGIIRSMVIVASGGKVYRVEPTNGITDPLKHREDGVELIQDDDFFNSAMVNLGAMGIIYSYIIEVRPTYWLYEKRSVEKWSDIRRQLEDSSLFDDYPIEHNGEVKKRTIRGYTIMVNPYETDGERICMVSRTFEVEKPKNLTRKEKGRTWLSEALSGSPITYWIFLAITNRFPKFLPKLVGTGIKSTVKDKFINISHKVLYTGSAYIQNKSTSCEFAYDLDGKQYLQTMDDLFAKIRQLSEEHNIHPAIPIGLRFTQASPAYISPEYGSDVCYVVTPSLLYQHGARLILNSYQDIHIKNGGKPHWAKMTNRVDGRTDLIRRWYPKLDTWLRVMRFFNSKDTFSNCFTDRMGLTTEMAPVAEEVGT